MRYEETEITFQYDEGATITIDLINNIIIDREFKPKPFPAFLAEDIENTEDKLIEEWFNNFLKNSPTSETIYTFTGAQKEILLKAGINEDSLSIFTECLVKNEDVKITFMECGLINKD